MNWLKDAGEYGVGVVAVLALAAVLYEVVKAKKKASDLPAGCPGPELCGMVQENRNAMNAMARALAEQTVVTREQGDLLREQTKQLIELRVQLAGRVVSA